MATNIRNIQSMARMASSHYRLRAQRFIVPKRHFRNVRGTAAQPQFEEKKDNDMSYREAHARFSQDGNPTLPHDKTFKGDWENDPAFRADPDYVQHRSTSKATDGNSVRDTLRAAKHTVQRVARKLDPRNMAENVQTSASSASQAANDAIKTMEGVAEGAQARAQEAGKTIGQQASAATDKVFGVDGIDDVKHEAEELRGGTYEQAQKAKRAAKEGAEKLGDRAQQAGSKAENVVDETFGTDPEHLKQQAKQRANEAKEQLKDTAEEVNIGDKAEVLKDQAYEQAQKLKAAAESGASTLKDKAKQAGHKAEEVIDRTFDVDVDQLENQASEQAQDLKETAEDKAQDAKRKASHTMSDAERKAKEMEHRAEEGAEYVADKAKQTKDKAADKVAEQAKRLRREAREIEKDMQ
eukprot:TRINITY_DN6528_c0_g1_i1.p1 TRINITY_DN6528_c0_g1~~TRINITY_DN6528_c0_g1_i1.p1  ORF type:complete len:466 (+),score=156.86 TRINITY_DN6528_c0_g1_i1:171-1400(+)